MEDLDYSRGAMPLYLQIKEYLRKKIENEEFLPGEIIPSEVDLQKYFNVSRITVRQAIIELANEGYLLRQRGKGTEVIGNTGKIQEKLNKIMSFTNEMQEKGLRAVTKLAIIRVQKAGKRIANALRIQENDDVYQVYRIRCVDDVPIVVFITYFKKAMNLPLDSTVYFGSLYEFIATHNNTKIAKIQEHFEAVEAFDKISEDLEIVKGSPVLKRTRISFDHNRQTVEYTESFYRGDKYSYFIEVNT
ncbi:GntR family transcriptional regulator [Propionispora hippei]|nr:GntR family transcriptional regulator [Propionispora hippei]